MRFRDAHARSGISEFLAWWKNELLGCLPARLRERLAAPPLLALARQSEQGKLELWKLRGQQELDRVLLEDPETDARRVQGMLDNPEEPVRRRILLLPNRQVLRRRIVLPAAAEDNLAQILAIEMDRQTPFSAPQVYFDCRITKRDTANQQIHVDFAVVPKGVLDAELEAARKFQLRFDVADVRDERDTALWGFNLLPASLRVQTVDKRARLNWLLGLSAVALLAVAMNEHLAARRAAAETLRDYVETKRVEAQQVEQLETRVKDAITGANFLTERKCGSSNVIEVILELTQRLPNDTWLERISFIGKQVQIQGQSNEANKLIGLLQKALTVSSPQVQGVIQPDPGTQKDRFTIQLDLKSPERCKEASA
jgi:general secretion pathway protein L